MDSKEKTKPDKNFNTRFKEQLLTNMADVQANGLESFLAKMLAKERAKKKEGVVVSDGKTGKVEG
jgi:hypothetical protein